METLFHYEDDVDVLEGSLDQQVLKVPCSGAPGWTPTGSDSCYIYRYLDSCCGDGVSHCFGFCQLSGEIIFVCVFIGNFSVIFC